MIPAELAGGSGKMVERIRAFDWRSTPLGPLETWPASLRTAATLMLGTPQPAYIAWGPELTSLYNDAYIPILGSKDAAALGQPFAHLWSEIWEQISSLVDATMNGEAQYFEDMPVPLAGRAGRPMSWFTFSYTPLRDDTGQVAGFYCAAIETTDKMTSARESAERLQLALDAANLGTFVWHVDEDRTDSDDRTMRLFGLTPEGTLSLAEALAKLIHPDDRDRYAAAVGRAIDPSGPGTLREDIRVLHPDRSEHWVTVTGQATFGGDPPRAIRLNGTAAEITAQKSEEARARVRTDHTAFLVSLGDALRPLEDPVAVQETAAEMLCVHLRANRVAYFEVSATDYRIERDATQGVPSLRGRYPINSFGSTLLAALQSGHPAVMHDIRQDPALSPQEKAEYAAVQIGAHIGVPLVKGGRLVAGLAVHSAERREWSDAEIALVGEVAERTWSAVERANAEGVVRTSEAKYRSLFESMDQGYCILEVMFDAEQQPFDFRFIEVNPAYQKQAGLTDVVGKRISELIPGLNAFWLETYGRIALSGDAERFQSPAIGDHYSHVFDVFAFRVGAPEQRRVAVLFTDISEQVQARESLRDADRRKDEFLATLAHELRNPLAPLRTGLELMRLAGNTAPPFDTIQGMMERQVEHMVRMIDDLLDVSRITAGRIHLQRQPTGLDALITSAAEANIAAIEAAGLHLDVRLPDEPVRLDVDATRIIQVLSNLLNNATKFTPSGGRITISARVPPQGDDGSRALEVSVSDTGDGIPNELLPQVFDLFTQGERASRGSQAGLGIGLALSRRLIELHGGRIDASSEGAGRGTTVTFRLPVVERDGTETETPPPTKRPPTPRRVVVIDDNHDAADIMALLIGEFGSEPHVAYDGLSGIRRVIESQAEVVFLDIGMPGIDGYETCRRIRAQAGAAPYIVALTGWGQDHDKKRAVEAGFDAHLTKPADPRAIEEVLSRLTAGG